MFSLLVKQMAERDGVTEQLKAENQLKWVARMNNIRSRATESVMMQSYFHKASLAVFAARLVNFIGICSLGESVQLQQTEAPFVLRY